MSKLNSQCLEYEEVQNMVRYPEKFPPDSKERQHLAICVDCQETYEDIESQEKDLLAEARKAKIDPDEFFKRKIWKE